MDHTHAHLAHDHGLTITPGTLTPEELNALHQRDHVTRSDCTHADMQRIRREIDAECA